MMISLEMGSGFQQTLDTLGEVGQAVVDAADRGLGKGVKIAAGNVAENYLTGQSLKRRTGNLARAVDGWMTGKFHGVVGVHDDAAVSKYSWLLGDEQKTITPTKGKFLAIPIGENRTPSGVAKFNSPRDIEGGFFIKSKGKLLFGYKRGKKGKFRPMFTLVKSVLVQGTGALYDGVLESADDITQAMQTEISRVKGVN